MDEKKEKPRSEPKKPAKGWGQRDKTTPRSLVRLRQFTLVIGVLMIIVLIVWAYMSLSFVYRSYQDATQPSIEQVDIHRLQVDTDRFNAVIQNLSQRTLY